MSEGRLLSLVARFPHPTALARRVQDRRVFAALRRMEARGLVTRRRGEYRLTRRGRTELVMSQALMRLLARPRVRRAPH
jgi:Mn-dependent DtxR family transcriptional regulator